MVGTSKNIDEIRILFAASGSIAIPVFKTLISLTPHLALLTAPDKPSGRGLQMSFSPLKTIALESGIQPLFQFEKLDGEARNAVRAFSPDLLIAFSYGKIFGPQFLSCFPLGGINIHPSFLPKYRGASPLAAAILNDDSEYGIAIQKIFLEVDSGDLLLTQGYPLPHGATTESLTQLAGEEAAILLAEHWKELLFLLENATPQSEKGISFAPLIEKKSGFIDWNQSAKKIECAIRAFTPWPKAWTLWDNQNLYIYQAEAVSEKPASCEAYESIPCGTVFGVDLEGGIQVKCREGFLRIQELQIQSKKRLDWKTFINGNRKIIGAQLGGKPHESIG